MKFISNKMNSQKQSRLIPTQQGNIRSSSLTPPANSRSSSLTPPAKSRSSSLIYSSYIKKSV